MTFLDGIFLISWGVILSKSIQTAKNEHWLRPHFFVFFSIGLLLLFFTFFPQQRSDIAHFIGVERWADALVYMSIIVLFFMMMVLLQKTEYNNRSLTTLIRQESLEKWELFIHSWEYHPKSKKKEFIFLIRTFNESSRIIDVLRSILGAWYSQILIVDDGSRDNTRDMVMKEFANQIIYIRHRINRGWGAALETGFEYIRRYSQYFPWKYVVTFDADGQMDINDMKKFEHFIDAHTSAEVIFWSRFIGDQDSNIPLMRKIVLIGWKFFTWFISGVSLTDAHNWFRVMTIGVIKKVRITMDWMEYASELIEEIVRKRVKIWEVPVTIHYDDYTLAKWQRYGGPLRIAANMIYKKFF